VCRMVTIFLPTRLSGLPRYLERVRETYKKFSRDTWIKVSAQNNSFCQNILTWLWASLFKISTFFTFPDIQSDGGGVRSRFVYWRKDLGQADLPDILDVLVKLKSIWPQKTTYNWKILQMDWKSIPKLISFTQKWEWFRVEVFDWK